MPRGICRKLVLAAALLALLLALRVFTSGSTRVTAPAAKKKLVACADHLNPPCSDVLSHSGKYSVSLPPSPPSPLLRTEGMTGGAADAAVQVQNHSIYTCETDMAVFGLSADTLHPNNRMSDYCPETCTNCFGAGHGGLAFNAD